MITMHSTDWLRALCDDLNTAMESITITALSIAPTRPDAAGPIPRLWRTLAGCERRGIRARLLVPAPSKAYPATWLNGQAAQKAAALNLDPRLIPLPRLLHAKTTLIDGEISWIGSGNFTTAAGAHNHEAYIRTTDPGIACALANFHQSILSEGTTT